MAKYRYVYTNFWESPIVSDTFTPEDKLFFLYLLTNAHTKQIGVYKLQKKLMAFELGYSIESIESLISRFEEHHRLIKYNVETREIAIKNWGKFNLNKGGKPIEDCINAELPFVEDKSLLLYVLEGIKSLKIRQIFIEELKKNRIIAENSDTHNGMDNDTYNDTSTISGQNENEKENKNKKQKENIYTKLDSMRECESSVDNVNSVDNLDESFDKDLVDSEVMFGQVRYSDIVNLYNKICKSFAKVETITGKRKEALKARWKTFKNIKIFEKLFSKAEASSFLSGRSGKWTACNFDWMIDEENMVKVLEGTYDNKKNNSKFKQTNFNSYEQREYDYADLEAKILAKSSEESAKAAANIELDDGYIAKQNKILGRDG